MRSAAILRLDDEGMGLQRCSSLTIRVTISWSDQEEMTLLKIVREISERNGASHRLCAVAVNTDAPAASAVPLTKSDVA